MELRQGMRSEILADRQDLGRQRRLIAESVRTGFSSVAPKAAIGIKQRYDSWLLQSWRDSVTSDVHSGDACLALSVSMQGVQ